MHVTQANSQKSEVSTLDSGTRAHTHRAPQVLTSGSEATLQEILSPEGDKNALGWVLHPLGDKAGIGNPLRRLRSQSRPSLI